MVTTNDAAMLIFSVRGQYDGVELGTGVAGPRPSPHG
jgi:hypothetical protein